VKSELLDAVENKSLKENVPHFEIGDVVDVRCRIKEGDKERIHETFTVRRIVANEGVERIFPLHSPNLIDIRPVRSGKARRAKLYYLRRRTGKAVKLAHRHGKHTVSE
jgi:large subunit ribosomal protein L19